MNGPAVSIWGAPALSRCGARVVATYDGSFFGLEEAPPEAHVHECDRDLGHDHGEAQPPEDDWHLCACLFRWP